MADSNRIALESLFWPVQSKLSCNPNQYVYVFAITYLFVVVVYCVKGLNTKFTQSRLNNEFS